MAGHPRAPLEELEREQRSGIPHYKPGQHRAYRAEDEPGAAVLVWVNPMGWAIILPCEREDGQWKPVGAVMDARATGISSQWQELDADFELSDRMRAALDDCEVIASSA